MNETKSLKITSTFTKPGFLYMKLQLQLFLFSLPVFLVLFWQPFQSSIYVRCQKISCEVQRLLLLVKGFLSFKWGILFPPGVSGEYFIDHWTVVQFYCMVLSENMFSFFLRFTKCRLICILWGLIKLDSRCIKDLCFCKVRC